MGPLESCRKTEIPQQRLEGLFAFFLISFSIHQHLCLFFVPIFQKGKIKKDQSSLLRNRFHLSCPQNTLRTVSFMKPATPNTTCYIAHTHTHTPSGGNKNMVDRKCTETFPPCHLTRELLIQVQWKSRRPRNKVTDFPPLLLLSSCIILSLPSLRPFPASPFGSSPQPSLCSQAA